MKVTKFEKNFLWAAFIEQWINALIKWFKKRGVAVLQTFQIERYIMTDVRFERISRAYVQNIMRHAKTTEFSSSYNQMLTAWNNLNLKFRMQISESTLNITLKFFFDFLNFKIIIWMKMTFRRFNNASYVNNINMTSKNRQVTNKQNWKWQNRFSQQSVNYDLFSYVSWSQDYIFYQFKNSAYQNYQQQYQQYRQSFNFEQNQSQDQFQQWQFVSIVLSFARQFL